MHGHMIHALVTIHESEYPSRLYIYMCLCKCSLLHALIKHLIFTALEAVAGGLFTGIVRFLKQLYLLAYGFIEGTMAVLWA